MSIRLLHFCFCLLFIGLLSLSPFLFFIPLGFELCFDDVREKKREKRWEASMVVDRNLGRAWRMMSDIRRERAREVKYCYVYVCLEIFLCFVVEFCVCVCDVWV